MKKVLILIILILAVTSVYFYINQDTRTDELIEPKEDSSSKVEKNRLPDEPIKLKNTVKEGQQKEADQMKSAEDERFEKELLKNEEEWVDAVKNYANAVVTNEEFESMAERYTHNTPLTKEEYLYRKVYHDIFGKVDACSSVWRPRWTNCADPSARCLKQFVT